jgi:hypothetical protein
MTGVKLREFAVMDAILCQEWSKLYTPGSLLIR